ncbi:MAG: hypothetical protein R3B47_13510 [Bacteroidia bacterium]
MQDDLNINIPFRFYQPPPFSLMEPDYEQDKYEYANTFANKLKPVDRRAEWIAGTVRGIDRIIEDNHKAQDYHIPPPFISPQPCLLQKG